MLLLDIVYLIVKSNTNLTSITVDSWFLKTHYTKPQSRHLELFVTSLGPFQSSFCGKKHCPSSGVLGLLQCLGVSSGIHMNARTQVILSTTLHCKKMINVIYFTCQSF